MPNGYPTKDEIAEFLEAKRKGGVEAIAKLLREKQAQKAQEPQSQEIGETLAGGRGDEAAEEGEVEKEEALRFEDREEKP